MVFHQNKIIGNTRLKILMYLLDIVMTLPQFMKSYIEDLKNGQDLKLKEEILVLYMTKKIAS